MNFPTHVTHYFEKDIGPLQSICDLDREQRREIIEREKSADTGFNRYSYGEEFFDFRLLADDLLMELYAAKFDAEPKRRPFFATLGDCDVVGGIYRDPYKVRIPIDHFELGELTFMCPDHFHLVSLMSDSDGKRLFGYQPPEDYSESRYPYFGKLLTYDEVVEDCGKLHIDQHLQKERETNGWYRYVETQIWSDPELILDKYGASHEVTPESYTLHGVTHLQNYKARRAGTD